MTSTRATIEWAPSMGVSQEVSGILWGGAVALYADTLGLGPVSRAILESKGVEVSVDFVLSIVKRTACVAIGRALDKR